MIGDILTIRVWVALVSGVSSIWIWISLVADILAVRVWISLISGPRLARCLASFHIVIVHNLLWRS